MTPLESSYRWTLLLRKLTGRVPSPLESERFVQQNPHLLHHGMTAPQIAGFDFVVEFKTERLFPLQPENPYFETIPEYIRQVERLLYPGHVFLVKCHWQILRHHIQQLSEGADEDRFLQFRWRNALWSSKTGAYLLIDQHFAPVFVQGEARVLYGYIYIVEFDYQGRPVNINPKVFQGQQRQADMEHFFLERRARLFRRRQKQLGKEGFSRKEMDLLHHLAEERNSCREVARVTNRSAETIRSHYKNILRKARVQLSPVLKNAPEAGGYMRRLALI